MNTLFHKVLEPFIEYIHSYQPMIVMRLEHKNFYHSFGWCIQEGDGEVCSAVKELLNNYVENLPTTLVDYLWWQTSDGRLEAKYIQRLAESTSFDTSMINLFEDGYFKQEVVVQALYEELHKKADKDYSEFENSLDY